MPNKDGSAIRGEAGHFRYKKDMALGNKFNKKGELIAHGPPVNVGEDTTDMETLGLKEKGKASVTHGTPDPKGIYTKAVAKGFNKTEQKNLLKARGVTGLSRANEAQLVDKILKSNPEGDENPKEEEAEDISEPPGETDKEVKYGADLENYKASALVTILKSLGVKKIPLTNKGKIKRILETQ